MVKRIRESGNSSKPKSDSNSNHLPSVKKDEPESTSHVVENASQNFALFVVPRPKIKAKRRYTKSGKKTTSVPAILKTEGVPVIENSSKSEEGKQENQVTLTSAQAQINYEEFVRSFSVPSYLYRYLAKYHRHSPIYLTRNLGYMRKFDRKKIPRKKKTLEEIIVSLNSSIHLRPKRNSRSSCGSQSTELNWPNEIEIAFDGFKDSELESEWVTVESSVNILARFSWKWRRKFRPMDSLVLISRDLGCACNGTQPLDPSVPTTARFRLADILRVAAGVSTPVSDEVLITEICPRISSAQLELQVNVFERRRAKYVNENEAADSLAQTSYPVVYSTATIPLFFAPTSSSSLASSFLFTPGKYELRLGIQAAPIFLPRDLKETPVELPSRTVMALEGGRPTSSNGDHRVAFLPPSSSISSRLKNHACTSKDVYAEWPQLKFRVNWNSLAPSPFCSNVPIKNQRVAQKRRPSQLDQISATNTSRTHCDEKGDLEALIGDENDSKTDVDVIYEFFFCAEDKQAMQLGRSRDLICPWCYLDCSRGDFPSCLLAHLRLCHPRFRFRAVQQTQKLLLQIFLDETYDGSNDCTPLPRSYRPLADSSTENGLDISLAVTSASRNSSHFPMVGGWTGYSGDAEHSLRYARKFATSRFLRSRRSPLKRASFSQLIYWRAVELLASSLRKRKLPLMSAAKEAVSTLREDATKLVSHRRKFYHSTTLQPITSGDDYDSEEEESAQWLRDLYQRRIQEITDVNKGEREMMQAWNAYLLSVKPREIVVADCNIDQLLLGFVKRYGGRIHQHNLRNAFVLHLANLYDYGILTPASMHQVIVEFESLNRPPYPM